MSLDSVVAQELGPAVSPEKTEELIEKFEGATRTVPGVRGWIISGIAVAMSLFALYGAIAIVSAPILRGVHLLFGLALIFLLFPARANGDSWRTRVGWSDVVLVLLSIAAIGYMFVDFDKFIYRSAVPLDQDIVFGALLILLILEAVRRAVGWHLALLALIFLVYGLIGTRGLIPIELPAPFGHRGYEVDRIVGHMYMTLEGIFGIPLDVSSSFIILFTIYGALLDLSGAGKFFVDFSFAALGRKPTGAGRTVTLASFLLGGPSGSGVATTVTLGSIAYPMLKKAGYDKESAGGMLSAGGIGAVLSPPVLGAASFIIAEFLKVSYLQVITMSLMPTLLYYLSIFLMIELDARKFGIKAVQVETPPLRELLLKYGYHLTSLFTIVIFMLGGFTAIMAVFWASVVAFLLSFLRRETALTPRRLWRALEAGSKQVLSVVATTAAAGLIIGIFTLTGLGLKLSGIIIDFAGANLFLALLYTAVAVWILGLALPITASYIIAAVMTAPALIKLGVPDYAAHMFIFYYAILSEVSPPVGLSPFAAAAITGGNPYKTMIMAWKYTLPAFIVPFMFTLSPDGVGLLLQGDLAYALWTTVTAMLGIAALVGGVGGWISQRANLIERALLTLAGLSLVYAAPWTDAAGLALLILGVGMHLLRTRRATPQLVN
ncbi:MAG: TRAP transporter permease [Chloroflexi bacterium]|nr:TRAP transporter permease [Chloroflexota bacterium]